MGEGERKKRGIPEFNFVLGGRAAGCASNVVI